MKPIRRKIIPFCFFMVTTLLFNCCTIYKNTPISLEEAVISKKKVKVITVSNEKLTYKQIQKKDTLYYGITIVNGDKISVPLNPDRIKTVKPKNKALSTVLTVGGITTGVLLLAAIIFEDAFDFSTGAGPVGGF